MTQSPRTALDILQHYESLYGKRFIQILDAANQHILMPFGDGMASGKPVPVSIISTLSK